MTKPSMMGVREVYSSVASSALSPWASSTGVVWVWKPVMVLGLPACKHHLVNIGNYTTTCHHQHKLDTHRAHHVHGLAHPHADRQRVELLVEGDQHPGLHGRGQPVQQVVGLACTQSEVNTSTQLSFSFI